MYAGVFSSEGGGGGIPFITVECDPKHALDAQRVFTFGTLMLDGNTPASSTGDGQKNFKVCCRRPLSLEYSRSVILPGSCSRNIFNKYSEGMPPGGKRHPTCVLAAYGLVQHNTRTLEDGMADEHGPISHGHHLRIILGHVSALHT